MVTNFNAKADAWLLNADNLYFEGLTDFIFRSKLISFPQRIILTIQEISNLSNSYLEKLHLLANNLENLMKINISS